MTNNSTCQLPLDSYRLAQYVNQIGCYICTGPNLPDAEFCRHCHAPLALAHQATNRKLQPQLISLLGASGVGKTVFLGMLMEMLSRQSAAPMQVLARGAFSLTLQQHTVASLANCEFPIKTSNDPDQWNWIHCLVKGPARKAQSEIILPDVAGEAILEEVDHPNSYPVLRALLEKCQGIALLVDAAKLQEGRHEQEHFVMKILAFLRELDTNPKHAKSSTPIAVIFTKADQSESSFDDPARFAAAHASGMVRFCQEAFSKLEFFATGIAGACAFRTKQYEGRQRIPLRVEPRGLYEPFQWLVTSMGKSKR